MSTQTDNIKQQDNVSDIVGTFPRWLMWCAFFVPLAGIGLMFLVLFGIQSTITLKADLVADQDTVAGKQHIHPGSGFFVFPNAAGNLTDEQVQLHCNITVPGHAAHKMILHVNKITPVVSGLRLDYSMNATDSMQLLQLLQQFRVLPAEMHARLGKERLIYRITGTKQTSDKAKLP